MGKSTLHDVHWRCVCIYFLMLVPYPSRSSHSRQLECPWCHTYSTEAYHFLCIRTFFLFFYIFQLYGSLSLVTLPFCWDQNGSHFLRIDVNFGKRNMRIKTNKQICQYFSLFVILFFLLPFFRQKGIRKKNVILILFRGCGENKKRTREGRICGRKGRRKREKGEDR